MRRVVITGLGALTPIGNNVSDFWNALQNGQSGAGMITKFDTEKFKAKFAGTVQTRVVLNPIPKDLQSIP